MIDENESNETSNIKVDEVDTNKCDETSEVTSNEIPRGESDEVPQECDSLADVKQVTKTPEQQQLSDAPEPAVQVVSNKDDAAQSAQPETAEQAGDAPVEAEPAVQMDKEPLDETQPVVQSPPEDRISRAVRLELERIQFEKEARRRY